MNGNARGRVRSIHYFCPSDRIEVKTRPVVRRGIGRGTTEWGWEAGLWRGKKWIVIGCGSTAGDREAALGDATQTIEAARAALPNVSPKSGSPS